jgi:hypothetical protein
MLRILEFEAVNSRNYMVEQVAVEVMVDPQMVEPQLVMVVVAVQVAQVATRPVRFEWARGHLLKPPGFELMVGMQGLLSNPQQAMGRSKLRWQFMELAFMCAFCLLASLLSARAVL